MKYRGERKTAGKGLCLLLAFLLAGAAAFSAAGAEVNASYPKAATKKGVYVTPGMEEDALELGIRHATINLSAGDFFPVPAYRSAAHSEAFVYNGQTYWFSKAALSRYDQELGRLAQDNVIVTAILLLPKRSDLLDLIYPAARGKSANYYQWDMTSAAAVNTLRAVVTFFQRRYAGTNGARIVGWIVGNEANNTREWNCCGNIGMDACADLYAAQCAEVYRIARSVCANTRVYMCLDHYWGKGNGSGWYAGKKFLKKFAAGMRARGLGNGTWNIAYHPYNVDLNQTDIMAESPSVTNRSGTRIITMKNLSVLTDFVRKNYSSGCRIILSEQGYSSVTGGTDVSAAQAQSVALAYYIAQNNSMVDSLILHRQVDHTAEVAQGGAFGLYTSSGGETAAGKKISWTAYKLADTTRTNRYTRAAERQAEKVTGKKVRKAVNAMTGRLLDGSPEWTMACMEGAAGYGAVSDLTWQNNALRLTHDSSRNANVPWGIRRNGKVNCRKMSRLGFGIRVDGAGNGTCTVTLRLWSGTKRCFEARRVISTGVPYGLYTDLAKWKYRGRITRIEILVTPKGSGWSRNAGASVWSVGIR